MRERLKKVAWMFGEKALDNVTPQVEVKSRRVGGATFQIPQEIRPSRKVSQGMKWLIHYSSKRNGKSMGEKLAEEIIAAVERRRCGFQEERRYSQNG